MKKFWKIFLIILGMFGVGILGALFVNYVVFSKLATHSVWSDNDLVKALSGKVTVIQNVEKVVVKDSESLLDISAQAAQAVIFAFPIDEKMSNQNLLPIEGVNGIVMSSDGVIAIPNLKTLNNVEKYQIKLADGKSLEAEKIFVDDFSNIIFLQAQISDLAVMPFANSDDVANGSKLIGIYKDKNSSQPFFNTGILSGFNFTFQTAKPSCDYLEGVFRVDFTEKSLAYNVGGPLIDFNGEMIGMVMSNADDEYFALPVNDIKNAFNNLLENKKNQNKVNRELVENENSSESSNQENLTNERVRLETDCQFISTGDLLEKNNLGTLTGAKISQLINGKAFVQTSAAKIGLLNNDIILKIDEVEVNLENPVSRILQNYQVGDKVKFQVLRNQEIIEIEGQL
jgi:S1-C subfamily serine protease